MRIDIWSDVVCPWCWIGKHRFERGLALMGDKAPEVEVRWHPFLLAPDADATPVPLREAYAAKFGGIERTNQMLAQTQSAAQAEGLPMDFDKGQVKVTTLPAHRLIWLAGREGVQAQVGEALFRAHFEHGRNLADPQVLIEAAAAGGIGAERVTAMLESDEGLAEVRAGLGQAQALGIQSVPTFVINGRYAVQGAQPPEVFAQVLEKVAAELAPTPGKDEQACGPDGCSV
ncbi:DsbA family oxidoreductase [Stenotrophomonas sp. SY1]|uniref:DsbA family oxidoreductase n=1 Tax=Stenotrophomonas sp. SY1 TaxID=477235 RepID=UPI001E4A4835|nr:DsbA family oxidoreductase [Stenotrophomonas sp. SY1]